MPQPYTALATDTDQYFLVEMQTFWLMGMNERTTFSLTLRSLPKEYGYLVAAGLQDALRYLENLHFTAEEIEGLASMRVNDLDPDSAPLFREDFLHMLARLRFTGEVWALPEGEVFGPHVPVLRVTAPRIEATLVETTLLSIVNRQTAVATKAARMVSVAGGRPLWEAGLRRAPGPETAAANARAAFIGGMVGTSAVSGALANQVPCTGSMAHSYVQAFGGPDFEQQAFEAWLTHNPDRATLLVDTYDINRGVQRAIAASQATGVPLTCIRIDSGNLIAETKAARAALDVAGVDALVQTRLMPTGDVDEYVIEQHLAADGEMDVSYSGTAVTNPGPLGGVFKLGYQEVGELDRRWVMKLAQNKSTDPGKVMAWRGPNGDVLAVDDEVVPDARPLLRRVMALGRVEGHQPTLAQIQARALASVRALPVEVRDIHAPVPLSVTRTEALLRLRRRLGDTTTTAMHSETALVKS